MNQLTPNEMILAAHLKALINEIEWHQQRASLVLQAMGGHWLSEAREALSDVTGAQVDTLIVQCAPRYGRSGGDSVIIGIDDGSVPKEQPLTAEAPCGAPVVWTPEDVQRLEVALEARFGPALEARFGVDPAQWADGDVIKLDTDGCVVVWNAEALQGQNTGQTPEEFGYMTPDELVRCVASKTA